MPKSPAQTLLDQLVAAAVVPVFRPDGYKKAGRNFRRSRERCVQVVNVEASQWGSADRASFTLNLGVFYPEVHELKTFLAWKPSAARPNCWVAAPGCKAPYPYCGEPNLACDKPRPHCPAGSVPTIVRRCWGGCVAVEDCRCSSDEECSVGLPGGRCVEGRCMASPPP